MNRMLLAALALAVVLPACQSAHRSSVSSKLQQQQQDTPLGNDDVDSISSMVSQLNLGPGSSFRPASEARTAKGSIRRKFQQTYAGMEVVDATAHVEVSQTGQLRGSVVGSLAYSLEQDIPDPRACQRTKQELLERSRSYLQHALHMPVARDTPLRNLRLARKVDFPGQEAPAKIVYELDFLVDARPTPFRPFLQLDACDADLGVLRYINMLQNFTIQALPGQGVTQTVSKRLLQQQSYPSLTESVGKPCDSDAPAIGVGGNEKIGKIVYGKNKPFCLKTEVSGSTCSMKSKYAIVLNMNRKESDGVLVEFPCSEGCNDPVNGAYGVANDAFFYGYATGAMHEEWYNIFALGRAPYFRVHYGECFENAYWDGKDMIFGDGCDNFYPLVNQDVVAHELGHGITDRFSGLEFEYQSGGINEAFSDMSGETAEAYTFGKNDWMIGYDIMKTGDAIRYMDTPSKDGKSIDSAKDYKNSMNVHYTSGVFNRAFYQLVKVQEMPIRKAYEIFLYANKALWSRKTNFEKGACNAVQAAYDLGYAVEKVKAAFDVVDVNLRACDFLSFAQVLESGGEAREHVLVSNLRNPVFQLDAGADTPSGTALVVNVRSPTSIPVKVTVTSDPAGNDVVVATGEAPFVFRYSAQQTNFFKLSSSQENDVTVEVSLSRV